MKVLVIFLVLIGIVTVVPQALGLEQNMFYGTSGIERVPETIIPGTTYDLEIKFQYTEAQYFLRNIHPEIQVSPQGAEAYVHIDSEKISIRPNAISRTTMTLQVDPEIPHEKIFLNISFVAENSVGEQLRSSWMDSLILDIGTNLTNTETQSRQALDESFSFTQKQVRYEMPYHITNGTVTDMNLNCNSPPNLTVFVSTDNSGILQLDVPNAMLGGIFMVLIDEQNWEDVSIDSNTITIIFPENTNVIKILGTYHLTDSDNNDGVCDAKHDPPYSFVLPPHKQIEHNVQSDEIQCKQNLVLVQKYDGTPACVTEQTKTKLSERGWTDNETQSNRILTAIDCVKGQLIYNDECIYVLTTIDEYPKGIKHFLLSENGKITQYVELEIVTSTSGQIGSAVTMDRSTAISSYTISDDNVIEFTLENENIFYGKPLSYWKNIDEDSLVNYYENFGKSDEDFFEDLAIFLIKSQAEEKLHELKIIPDSEIVIDWEGIRPSLPPRMVFYATVNSTDGKNYHITGTIHGNVIQGNFEIIQDNGRRLGWTPAFEYDRVQINGTTALQICSILEIACIENPVWDAVHRHDKDFTYFIYETSDIEHYVKIDDGHICHSIENFTSQEISELECQEIKQ